jgi:hypothetical protein
MIQNAHETDKPVQVYNYKQAREARRSEQDGTKPPKYLENESSLAQFRKDPDV